MAFDKTEKIRWRILESLGCLSSLELREPNIHHFPFLFTDADYWFSQIPSFPTSQSHQDPRKYFFVAIWPDKKRELKMTFKLVLTTANSIIGVSILSMPYCYKECGKSRTSLLIWRKIEIKIILKMRIFY